MGSETVTTEGGRRPQKRCSSCGRNTASAYYWWLEETSIRFVCRECRDSRATGARVSPAPLALEPLVHLDEEPMP
jgi:hypothetical protein